MTYQLVGGSKGAKLAFENEYGECGDYSALFVALCRAAGIPARPVVGRWATSEAIDWHVWAEFHLPGYGWVPVDPTVADTTGQLEDNFGHLDNK
jgi:transglutaminase-like putative cysteine protease